MAIASPRLASLSSFFRLHPLPPRSTSPVHFFSVSFGRSLAFFTPFFSLSQQTATTSCPFSPGQANDPRFNARTSISDRETHAFMVTQERRGIDAEARFRYELIEDNGIIVLRIRFRLL